MAALWAAWDAAPANEVRTRAMIAGCEQLVGLHRVTEFRKAVRAERAEQGAHLAAVDEPMIRAALRSIGLDPDQ